MRQRDAKETSETSCRIAFHPVRFKYGSTNRIRIIDVDIKLNSSCFRRLYYERKCQRPSKPEQEDERGKKPLYLLLPSFIGGEAINSIIVKCTRLDSHYSIVFFLANCFCVFYHKNCEKTKSGG